MGVGYWKWLNNQSRLLISKSFLEIFAPHFWLFWFPAPWALASTARDTVQLLDGLKWLGTQLPYGAYLWEEIPVFQDPCNWHTNELLDATYAFKFLFVCFFKYKYSLLWNLEVCGIFLNFSDRKASPCIYSQIWIRMRRGACCQNIFKIMYCR